MVTTIRTGRYGPKKAAKKAPLASFTKVADDAKITWLEKGGQSGGATTKELIEDALDEYSRLFKAGIASNAEKLTLARAFPDAPSYVAAAADIPESSVMVVGGPASVEMIDREGHLIKADALDRAFKKYMENFRTRNAMVLHSDVQVGWALPAYITKGGQIYKSGVNNKELFFICELRDDTRIAERVAKQIEDGKLRSYSIAGSATKVQNMQKGVMPYMQVEDMELAEVTVCEKGVNQGAAFQILKAQTGKISKDQCGFRPATEVEIENGIMCGTCKFFNKEDKTCDTVDGVFDDTDYCKIFDAEEAQPEMEEGPKVKVRLILSDDNNIEFNKTLQELVQNPEWSTTSAGQQTQRDFWDWDLEKDWNPFKKDPAKEAAKNMGLNELDDQGMKNFEHFITMYPNADSEAHIQAWMDRPDAYHAYYTNTHGNANMDYINQQAANVKEGKGIIVPSMQKGWNPFKSDAQKSKEMGEKLDRLREENPKFFAEQDARSAASRSNIMQELKDRAAAKAAGSEMEKQANTDRARVYADPKHTMMDEADKERATKPKMHRSTARGIQEKIQNLLARDDETLGEKQQSIELKQWGDRQTKSYLERARDDARERRPKVDRKDPPTLPVVSEVREEMEGLPKTISRGDKGDTKMEKSLTNRLIDLYKATGDISFTTPSKGRGNAGMGGGTVTPAMGNPELQLAEEGKRLSIDERMAADPTYSPFEPAKRVPDNKEEIFRRGKLDVDVSDRGVRGKDAELRGLNPETGRPYRQPGVSAPMDEEGRLYDTSNVTDEWTESSPDSPSQQKYGARKYQEHVLAQGGGPSGPYSGEGDDHVRNPYRLNEEPKYVPNTRTESMQRLLDAYKKKPMPKATPMPERAAREGMSREQSQSMDIRASMDMEKGATMNNDYAEKLVKGLENLMKAPFGEGGEDTGGMSSSMKKPTVKTGPANDLASRNRSYTPNPTGGGLQTRNRSVQTYNDSRPQSGGMARTPDARPQSGGKPTVTPKITSMATPDPKVAAKVTPKASGTPGGAGMEEGMAMDDIGGMSNYKAPPTPGPANELASRGRGYTATPPGGGLQTRNRLQTGKGDPRPQSGGMGRKPDVRPMQLSADSLTDRLIKLYKANDDPMTTKESFTALTNEEARQKEHDQLLREYGFPSEVDPEANRYIPVIETETDDKGIPINTKGPWVVNEAGNDIGESHDEDAPSFSTSEKAHNREGKKTASVSKSYLEKPPVTPFLSTRSL